ncbi:RNA methyltransferase [Phyllosticta citricarpa]|uniref:rRNA methyltransferase 1, mitochondrial n=2 Tax=Phyllosticta TaxID=121621 RepID=A0ABR1NDA3_9PEZI
MSAIHNGIRGDNYAEQMRAKIIAYEDRQRRPRRKALTGGEQDDSQTERKNEQEGEIKDQPKDQPDVRPKFQPEEYGSISVPHTTAASKFIYGYSSVFAALKAKRRLLYKLYYHPRARRRASSLKEKTTESHQEDLILALAAGEGQKIKVAQVKEDFLPVMDTISGGRPHNGVVLETSPLPVKPVERLTAVSRLDPWFSVSLARQSPEELMINGYDSRVRYNSHGWRHPLVLFLHGITDAGNIGAIIRSAHYLGVDAIALASRSTASIDDPVVIKASSGATEAMPILRVNNPYNFLRDSGNNGWRIYAAEAPPPPEDNLSFNEDQNHKAIDQRNTSPLVNFRRPSSKAVFHNHRPLANHPVILMMGGEHAGIDARLAARVHYYVGIRGVHALNVGVDSLNVSVASALIMMEFLKRREKLTPPNKLKPGTNFLF